MVFPKLFNAFLRKITEIIQRTLHCYISIRLHDAIVNVVSRRIDTRWMKQIDV